MTSLANEFKNWRKQSKISQKQAATLLNRSQTWISRLERGEVGSAELKDSETMITELMTDWEKKAQSASSNGTNTMQFGVGITFGGFVRKFVPTETRKGIVAGLIGQKPPIVGQPDPQFTQKREAASKSPDCGPILSLHELVCRALKNGRPSDALSACDGMLALCSNDNVSAFRIKAMSNKALALDDLGRFEQSIELFEEVIQDPHADHRDVSIAQIGKAESLLQFVIQPASKLDDEVQNTANDVQRLLQCASTISPVNSANALLDLANELERLGDRPWSERISDAASRLYSSTNTHRPAIASDRWPFLSRRKGFLKKVFALLVVLVSMGGNNVQSGEKNDSHSINLEVDFPVLYDPTDHMCTWDDTFELLVQQPRIDIDGDNLIADRVINEASESIRIHLLREKSNTYPYRVINEHSLSSNGTFELLVQQPRIDIDGDNLIADRVINEASESIRIHLLIESPSLASSH